MNRQNKMLLTMGIVLIVFGILLAVFLIKAQYDDCVESWNKNLDGFGYKYDSAKACFWERSSGVILLYVFLGSMPFYAGCYLLSKI